MQGIKKYMAAYSIIVWYAHAGKLNMYSSLWMAILSCRGRFTTPTTFLTYSLCDIYVWLYYHFALVRNYTGFNLKFTRKASIINKDEFIKHDSSQKCVETLNSCPPDDLVDMKCYMQFCQKWLLQYQLFRTQMSF